MSRAVPRGSEDNKDHNSNEGAHSRLPQADPPSNQGNEIEINK